MSASFEQVVLLRDLGLFPDELAVELEVEPVDVESVLLVVSASTLSGPAKPALAK